MTGWEVKSDRKSTGLALKLLFVQQPFKQFD